MFEFFNKKAKEDKELKELIPKLHHRLMKEYGWIPLEEFKRLPVTTVFSLIEQIEEENKEINNALKRSKNE